MQFDRTLQFSKVNGLNLNKFYTIELQFYKVNGLYPSYKTVKINFTL